jgi:phosphohistidine phosphatase
MTARTLVLLRHAKAETPGDLLDFDRRLTAAGQASATAAGVWLAARGLHPDLVFCSPAARTRQTWHGVAVALADADPVGRAPEVGYAPALYESSRTAVVDLLRTVPDDVRTVLVVGHNPTMSDVSLLLRPDDPGAGRAELRTSGIAVHRSELPWSQTEPGSMELVAEHTARG